MTRTTVRHLVATAAMLLAAARSTGAQAPAVAGSSAPAAPSPRAGENLPVAEGGRIFSMGQPPRLKWYGSAVADFEKDAGLAVIGAQRDLMNPMVGLLAGRVEGLFGGGRDGVEGGARLLATSPALKLQFGLDWDAREGELDFLVGAELLVRRGGLFGNGSRVRIGWLPWRDQTWQVGLSVPIGQRAGRTRPRSDRARVTASRPPDVRAALTGDLATAFRDFQAAAAAVLRLTIPMRGRLEDDPAKGISDIAAANALDPPDRVLQRMMDAWTQVFRAALSAVGEDGAQVATLATRARRIALEDVILPFDGLLGQRRTAGSIYVFVADAEKRFQAELATAGLSAAQRGAALTAFHAALLELDRVRAGIRRASGEDARVFMPLQLALAPGEADTQVELDGLLERATGDRFRDGNRVSYVINESFQFEVARTVGLAERYHVLWIHDVRGAGESTLVDRISALHVREYLRALTDRVVRFDEVGTLPEYHIILDQFYYESNNGRRWMTLLEHPLTHHIAYPADHAAEQAMLREAQQALQTAVAGSRRLQEQRARFGEDWLRDLVKVHVSITHPSDFSYWAEGLFPLLGMPDNLMRDHRKIVFYDLSEDDPAAGEVHFSGMGLGEHYSGPTWEDRALIVQGPAALPVKAAVRRLFERQGFPAARLSAAFQERPLAADYEQRVERMRQDLAAGAIPPAKAQQSHNDVGYGVKRATVAKALLLSTMPAGSVLISPDSLWEDYLWASLMAGSALRGCRVLLIATSLDNSPGTSWLVTTRMHMLVSQTMTFARGVEARIAAAGGLLKVGLFSEHSGVGDLKGRAEESNRTYQSTAWLQTLAPFNAAALEGFRRRIDEVAATMPASYLVEPEQQARPKLHMKGLYVASRSAWDGVFERPEMEATLVEYITARAKRVSRTPEPGDARLRARAAWTAGRTLFDAHKATLSPEALASVVLYLQIGSLNMNDRSMLLDGEVELTVSGLAAQSGLLDFIWLAGLTTWVENQEQIDALLPKPSGFKLMITRWARSVL